ncbi:hypothetical protein RB614_40865 [Phytohabitans sp. ZYX-F-186]|uniref:Uncharacterized protein n=1 Tax=Phytohabitans maris TaxID=3071409 RepID=A0ABU0ZV03_9ACTN|nr:hypothetical protein [Phytohabitans sp. ZYX-F-186]MDQ7910864.1 hypothetical protein [Phytohabitans sp. ZYX-F-186]
MGEIVGVADLDYYVVMEGGGRAAAVVVEEFVLAGDHTAAGLASAAWTAGGWGPSLSRRMRSDPDLRARVVFATRVGAAEAFRVLGGGELPGEAELRRRLRDYDALNAAPPLRLGLTDTPYYRILFAGEPADESAHPGLRRIGNGVAWCVDITAPEGTNVGSELRAARDAMRRNGLIPVTVERFY